MQSFFLNPRLQPVRTPEGTFTYTHDYIAGGIGLILASILFGVTVWVMVTDFGFKPDNFLDLPVLGFTAFGLLCLLGGIYLFSRKYILTIDPRSRRIDLKKHSLLDISDHSFSYDDAAIHVHPVGQRPIVDSEGNEVQEQKIESAALSITLPTARFVIGGRKDETIVGDAAEELSRQTSLPWTATDEILSSGYRHIDWTTEEQRTGSGPEVLSASWLRTALRYLYLIILYVAFPAWLLVSGAANLYVVGEVMWRLERLRTRGRVVEGTIVAKDQKGVSRPFHYYLTYHLGRTRRPKISSLPGPDELDEYMKSYVKQIMPGPLYTSIVSERIFNSFETGQAVPVTITDDDPPLHTVGRVDSARVWRVPLWRFENALGGLAFTGFGIYLCVMLYAIPLYRYLRKRTRGKAQLV